MIGDSLESDVLGALNNGWEAIFLSNDKEHYTGHQIENLIELKKIL